MKTFRIHGGVVGSKYLGEIEAETAQEALERAPRELDFAVNLCCQCSDQCEDPEIDEYVAEEADGDELSKVDGFWEGKYYTAQARVLELEQQVDAMRRCSTALRNLKPKEESVRNEVLEEAAKAIGMKTPKQYAEDLNFGNESIWNTEVLTRTMARRVLTEAMAEARAEALEEAAKAVEALMAPELVFSPGTPLSLLHPNRTVEKAAACVRSLKRKTE